jgi:8-oxo-dGTP diphosphatase
MPDQRNIDCQSAIESNFLLSLWQTPRGMRMARGSGGTMVLDCALGCPWDDAPVDEEAKQGDGAARRAATAPVASVDELIPGPGAPADPAAEPPRVVVAAVIERDGLILAGRRSEPPALAGLWEFPGGKVEPGESDRVALERECLEELGVRVVVGEPVGPSYPIRGGAMIVRTYLARLADGEPEPQPFEGHDELRWVPRRGPQTRALDWLPGDLLILDALDDDEAGD